MKTNPAPARWRLWVSSVSPLRLALAALLLLPVLLAAGAALYVSALVPFTPTVEDLRKIKTAKPSTVISSDGVELASFKRANREWVKLGDMSPHLVAALVSTEDKRFYEHRGLDIRRSVSALLHTVSGDRQGGSTITQQLARNLYPEEIGRSATLTRKVKEGITALKIESVYTKDEILETYLNTVPFLYNAYGIEMAARTYFDKTADQLDVLQSATLIGMLKGTAYYNPVLNPDRALQRRNTVLAQMAKNGKLDANLLPALKKEPLKVDFERQGEEPGPAPHFAQQLRRWLIDWADRHDYNIYADGLVLRTTIDSRLQTLATEALKRQADKLQAIATTDWSQRTGWSARKGPRHDLVMNFMRESPAYKALQGKGLNDAQALEQLQSDAGFMQALREEKTRLQAGFLALDPRNGRVMAWVGSRDFAEDQFDHVQQARRQPGSTFKPFVYGAAFESGSKPTDAFMDQPVEIPMGDGTYWRPSDGGGPSGAVMTLREGLMFSKNTITAQVMQVVGPQNVAKLAVAMGVRQSKLDEVPSLALGTSPVTLREMVASYATITNDGRYIEPISVLRVEDRDGKVLEEFAPKLAEAAMSLPASQTLLDVMRGVVDRGTGAAIRSRYGIKADVAGKTGTTQDNTDGWFILMHPQLVAGAWVGFNDNRVTMGDRWGPGAQSALPMVGDFFQQAIKEKMVDIKAKFNVPQGISAGDPTMVFNSNGLPGVGMYPPGSEPPLEMAPGPQAMVMPDPRAQASSPPVTPITPSVRYVTIPAATVSGDPAGTAGGGPRTVYITPGQPPVEVRRDASPSFPLSEMPQPAAR